MSQKRKQTARKTTGKDVELTSILAQSSSIQKPAKRARYARMTATAGTSAARFKSSSAKSILTRPIGVTFMSDWPAPSGPLPDFFPSLQANVPSSTSGPSTNESTLRSGTLIRRRQAVSALDVPISVCTRFATWLETQKSVHDDVLLRAVDRDGSHLLSLARATVMFDNALRGNTPIPPSSVNGVVTPLGEHARTLRVFAELLKSKISEGTLNEELETAVLRDGEALLRLALGCLDFDQVIRGSDSAT